MLDPRSSPDLTGEDVFERLWQCLGCHVQLPEPLGTFLAQTGVVPKAFCERRRWPRFHYRSRAIFFADGAFQAVYTKDLSHQDLSFYHASQLAPGLVGELFLGNGTCLQFSVQRCRRIAEACYECGVHIETIARITSEDLVNRVSGGTTTSSTRPANDPRKPVQPCVRSHGDQIR
jgi:hypothetical protein